MALGTSIAVNSILNIIDNRLVCLRTPLTQGDFQHLLDCHTDRCQWACWLTLLTCGNVLIALGIIKRFSLRGISYPYNCNSHKLTTLNGYYFQTKEAVLQVMEILLHKKEILFLLKCGVLCFKCVVK